MIIPDSILQIARMSESDAKRIVRQMRWPPMGEPHCIKCGVLDPYEMACGKVLRCRACRFTFTVTSKTALASQKKSARDLLFVAAMFAGDSKGPSANALASKVGWSQKSVFHAFRKFREAISRSKEGVILNGIVEVDGAFFGGHRYHENKVRSGRVFRITRAARRNRRVVVVARERNGQTLTFVVKSEAQAVPLLAQRINREAVISCDGARAWNGIEAMYRTLRVEHKLCFVANDASTNFAESFFAMFRKKHQGVHHQISGKYMQAYADELAWRFDTKDMSLAQRTEDLLRILFTHGQPSKWAQICAPRVASEDPIVRVVHDVVEAA